MDNLNNSWEGTWFSHKDRPPLEIFELTTFEEVATALLNGCRLSTNLHWDMKMKNCTCGNPEMGFDCICEWVRSHPGTINYVCEFCGCYTASTAHCNKCEESAETRLPEWLAG
jgi:hypothetical protein